jgi:hypothetical protein
MQIKPAEGMVAVRFVDDEEDDDASNASSTPSSPVEYECCLAVVSAVGAKVNGVKVGSTVICSPWAKDSPRIGDLRIVYASEIKGTVTG